MNLVYTIINLIVLFLLLRHFLIKPVSDIMEKRRQMIADGLQGAQDAQSDAQKMKQEYEDALKGAKLESAAIVEKARSEAKTEDDRIVPKLRDEQHDEDDLAHQLDDTGEEGQDLLPQALQGVAGGEQDAQHRAGGEQKACAERLFRSKKQRGDDCGGKRAQSVRAPAE